MSSSDRLDLHLAESVISADDKVDELQRDLESRAIALLARQQPVATDLRLVVTSLRMSADLERAGDLAQHMAKLARLRFASPQPAVPSDLDSTILEMGQLAQRLMGHSANVLVTKGCWRGVPAGAGRRPHGRVAPRLFQHLLDERWKHGVETAVDVTLVGRYYERFADHAVSVGRRVVYLVTGEHVDELTAHTVPQSARERPR